MPREKRCRSRHRIREFYGWETLKCSLPMGHAGKHEDHKYEPPSIYAWTNYSTGAYTALTGDEP